MKALANFKPTQDGKQLTGGIMTWAVSKHRTIAIKIQGKSDSQYIRNTFEKMHLKP